MDEYAEYRKEKQPIDYPSAGSTFKRGTDFITAKLIDEAGLKGYSIGGAKISEKHAGFIINTGNATAQDVLDLVKYVTDIVYEKFGKGIKFALSLHPQTIQLQQYQQIHTSHVQPTFPTTAEQLSLFRHRQEGQDLQSRKPWAARHQSGHR